MSSVGEWSPPTSSAKELNYVTGLPYSWSAQSWFDGARISLSTNIADPILLAYSMLDVNLDACFVRQS